MSAPTRTAFSCLMAVRRAWGLTRPPSHTVVKWPRAMKELVSKPFSSKVGTICFLTHPCNCRCRFIRSGHKIKISEINWRTDASKLRIHLDTPYSQTQTCRCFGWALTIQPGDQRMCTWLPIGVCPSNGHHFLLQAVHCGHKGMRECTPTPYHGCLQIWDLLSDVAQQRVHPKTFLARENKFCLSVQSPMQDSSFNKNHFIWILHKFWSDYP